MYGIYEDGKIIAKFVVPTKVVSNSPSFTSDSLSLKRSTSGRPSQRWELSPQIQPLSATANDLFALLVVSGPKTPINILTPQNPGVIARRKGKGSVLASGNQNGSTITVTTTNLIPRGTLVRFANHSKVYMITSERDGSGTCGVYPALRSGLVNVNVFWRDNVIMPVYMETSNIFGMTFKNGLMVDSGIIEMVEAL